MDVAVDMTILRNNKRIVAGHFRKEIKKYKTVVRGSLLHSYLQTIRLDYIMFNSQMYNLIINEDRTYAYELLQRINHNYVWKLEKHQNLVMELSASDELFTLHAQLISYAKNILRSVIHNELAYTKSQVVEFNHRVDLILNSVNRCLNQIDAYQYLDVHGQLVEAS